MRGTPSLSIGEGDGIDEGEGPAGMGAARWVVIGTALAAAATASYMLMGPSQRDASPDGAPRAVSDSGGLPQDQIDAESRAAMRDFLRQSAGEEESDP